ncbi:hypothetical protein ACFL3Q_03645 [Planctomycetota bacterium]
MKRPIIGRYFSADILPTIKSDFVFLVKKIIQSGFEYDLQIRDGYFNLYYRGNSLGKVSYRKQKERYTVEIHEKFVSKNAKLKEEFEHRPGKYFSFTVPRGEVHRFFRSEHLRKMGTRVREVNYQEETTFEQMLITDNVGSSDVIIIDRQIEDRAHPTKMDLLALVRKEKDDYQFCIIEVKLGNNPELRGDVNEQLAGYKKRVSDNFDDYRKCYEVNLSQKQELGLLGEDLNINIVPGVLGVVIVGGYSGIAEKSIEELKKNHPDLKVLHLRNSIDLSKVI